MRRRGAEVRRRGRPQAIRKGVDPSAPWQVWANVGDRADALYAAVASYPTREEAEAFVAGWRLRQEDYE
jgi:phosphoglycolate phosphatase-like HAD superfamily hydrolase